MNFVGSTDCQEMSDRNYTSYLPFELRHMIISLVSTRTDLAALRLVNKDWSQQATIPYFEHLTVDLRGSYQPSRVSSNKDDLSELPSVKKFMLLAHTPYINCVRKLKIRTVFILSGWCWAQNYDIFQTIFKACLSFVPLLDEVSFDVEGTNNILYAATLTSMVELLQKLAPASESLRGHVKTIEIYSVCKDLALDKDNPNAQPNFTKLPSPERIHSWPNISRHVEAVTRLEISFPVRLVAYLKDMPNFKALQHLSLKSVQVNDNGLFRLLRCNIGTLSTINLANVVIRRGTWADIYYAIKCCVELTEVVVRLPLYSCNHSGFADEDDIHEIANELHEIKRYDRRAWKKLAISMHGTADVTLTEYNSFTIANDDGADENVLPGLIISDDTLDWVSDWGSDGYSDWDFDWVSD